MNGFKLCLGTATLSGAQIQDLYRRCLALRDAAPQEKKGATTALPLRNRYIDMLVENSLGHMGQRKLKVVVDAGNGVGGLVGPEVLRKLGVEVIELFCEPDGSFPNHHPDPTVMENIQVLIARVKAEKADFGIGWDGDADRIGVVDEQGRPIFGDMLLMLYARQILAEQPGATIIGDVKCSSILFEDIRAHGGSPIMWKTGHSLIKGKLRETQGALAGEMSGHIFFKHRYFGFDDALYASSRIVELVSKFDGPVSTMLAGIPQTVATPEIRVDCPERVKFQIMSKAQEKFSDYPVDTTDGVRISFPHGWGLLRASNTQPVLVMRFEATTESEIRTYESVVRSRLAEIRAEVS
jgi:phosphomannomutase/phosphoglucomutase